MALIDFECTRCGHKFFEIMRPQDAEKVKCPKCEGMVRRVYKEESCTRHSGKDSAGCSGSCSSCRGCH